MSTVKTLHWGGAAPEAEIIFTPGCYTKNKYKKDTSKSSTFWGHFKDITYIIYIVCAAISKLKNPFMAYKYILYIIYFC